MSVRRLAILGGVGLLALLLVGSQLILPGVAAQQLRDRLSRSGRVLSVEVDAFPAIELLWHQADTVRIRLETYRSGISDLQALIGQAADVGSIDASVAALSTGLVTLRDATLRKRGEQLTGTATITDADLRSAVPFISNVQPVASGNGQLTLQGTATLLGVSASVQATVSASNGRMVVQPDIPFGGLATVTVFSDPRVEVQGVSAVPAPGGFIATAQGRLR